MRPMTRVKRSDDCGNSPKNAFVENFTIALATRDGDGVAARVSDDVCLNVVGRAPIVGKDAVMNALDSMAPVTTLTIAQVVTHGRAGAVNGVVEYARGGGAEFCNVYVFSSAKGNRVSDITAYIVPIGPIHHDAR